MKDYLSTYIRETSKIGLDDAIEVEGPSGLNMMTVQTIIDHILIAPELEQKAIKNTLVHLDFLNGDVRGYFHHLAKAIAV